jgi:tRNA (cytidine32/guanosine34-2'-O)-methyltransferase
MSKRFVSEKRDPYYRRAKEVGYRARSAYKLLQIHDVFGILGPEVTRVVDLCSAPGSWSQVLSQRLVVERRAVPHIAAAQIVAVDLQAMAPVEGVIIIQGDITARKTATDITSAFAGSPADLVVCDGAPDVTGLHDVDEFLQWQLLASAVNIASHVLDAKSGRGAFVAKIFTGPNTGLLVTALRSLFRDVTVYKPLSSRPGSHEAFIIAQVFSPPLDWTPSWDAPALANGTLSEKTASASVIDRLIALGDLARATAGSTAVVVENGTLSSSSSSFGGENEERRREKEDNDDAIYIETLEEDRVRVEEDEDEEEDFVDDMNDITAFNLGYPIRTDVVSIEQNIK